MRLKISYFETTLKQRAAIKRKIRTAFPEADLVSFSLASVFTNPWDTKPRGRDITLTFNVHDPKTK